MKVEIKTKLPTKNQTRRPDSVFKYCPECRSPNIVKVDGEVICTYCDWNSIASSAECSHGLFSFEPRLLKAKRGCQ